MSTSVLFEANVFQPMICAADRLRKAVAYDAKLARLACCRVVCRLTGVTFARTYRPARLRANTSPPSLLRASEMRALVYFKVASVLNVLERRRRGTPPPL